MAFTGCPAIVDDDGTGQSGTIANEAWQDDLLDCVSDSVFSVTNPAISPADIIDEVVTARGSRLSLDDRLDESLEEDGTLIIPTNLATRTEIQGSLAATNLVRNDQFLVWPLGDAANPAGWTLSGAGGAVARVGTGLADTNRKHGLFAARTTAALDVKTVLTQVLLDSAVVANPSFFNRKISVGGKVRSNVGGRASVSVSDGVTETTSSTHSGSLAGGDDADGWEWLSVTHTISSSATSLEVRLNISAGAVMSAYWSGVVCILSEIAPTKWVPAPVHVRTYDFFWKGALATGANPLVIWPVSRLGIILDAAVVLGSAPAGAGDTTLDINTWDGAAYTTAFTTKITPADATTFKNGAPDATYARRCLAGSQSGTAPATGGAISVDVDAVSATPGSDAGIQVRVLEYLTAMESLRAFDDVA